MTTANRVTLATTTRSGSVLIAGVPWPLYKVIALVVGFAVLLVIGVATMSGEVAILAAAGATSVVWLGLSMFHPDR